MTPLEAPSRFRSPITKPGYRAGIPSPNKGKHFAAEPLKPAEILRLMDACNHGTTGKRNRAILAVLWRTGCRVGELVNLRPVDIDPESRTIRIREGKTHNADRIVGVDTKTLEVIAAWQQARAKLGADRLAPLFCTVACDHLGYPLSTAQVRNTLRNLADKCGIEKRVHPHGFRHTFAAELAQEGVDLRVIQKALGHSSVAITQIYVDHLYPGQVIEAMATRLWSFE